MQFHLEFITKNEEPKDDFNINDWLLPLLTLNALPALNINLADSLAKTHWEIPAWLNHTNAKTVLQPFGWNIEATFNLLQRKQDKPFKTYHPTVDYGSYNFNWELTPLSERMYRAEIKERWIQTQNKEGKNISCIPVIDLHIHANGSEFGNFPKILKAFKPYPEVPVFDLDTPTEIEQKFLAAEAIINRYLHSL